MPSRLRVLDSSVGTKILIGLTGLAMFAFLITHIAGNLLFLFGPDIFNRYSHALIANPLVSGQPILYVVRHHYQSHYHAIDTLFHTGEANTRDFVGGGAIRAIDFASQQPGTDMERLGCGGGSMGGYYTLLAAGVDQPQGVIGAAGPRAALCATRQTSSLL